MRPVQNALGMSSLSGVGIGLRATHYETILNSLPQVPWFEALTDNYMGRGGLPLHHLERVAEHYPITLHGVGLSLGSTDPLNTTYLKKLKQLCERFQPVLVSDHLCWSSVSNVHGHDLFPLPYTERAAKHIGDRIQAVQDFLGHRILVENVSSYLQYKESMQTEAEFLVDVIERADCNLLCDINNIFVSASNHNFDAQEYLELMPVDRVQEMHLAGYEDQGTHLLDTHGAKVHAPVWSLYERALQRFGQVPTLIEWDTNIPEFSVLMAERDKAAAYHADVKHHVASGF